MKPLFVLLALLVPLTLHAASPTGGVVVFADGAVTADGASVDTGDSLPAVVTLKTGPKATVEVVFADKNVFRLAPNTTVRVDFARTLKTVQVDQGGFSAVLKKLSKVTGTDRAFLVRTPTAQAGIRGTTFHLEVTADRTYFCTCNGEVDLTDAAGVQEVDLKNAHHGSRIYTKAADGSIVLTEGGLEGHTDASMQTLARRIGVVVDWSKPDLDHGN